MSDSASKFLTVYRLMPAFKDFQTLHLGSESMVKLKRWQFKQPSATPPEVFGGEWDGDEAARKAEFPSGYAGAPVLSRRAVESLGGSLLLAGSFRPIVVDGSEIDDFSVFLVEKTVDCVDVRRSSKPKKVTGEVKKLVLLSEQLPIELPAFRLPQFPVAVLWNGWAVERLTSLMGDDIEARLVWSEDPELTSHPNPWGF